MLIDLLPVFFLRADRAFFINIVLYFFFVLYLLFIIHFCGFFYKYLQIQPLKIMCAFYFSVILHYIWNPNAQID